MALTHKEYAYSGPVMIFDNCVEHNWKATTWAASEKKALSNLSYRYKRDHNLVPNARVVLTGAIKPVR